jgi:hypothetical protein
MIIIITIIIRKMLPAYMFSPDRAGTGRTKILITIKAKIRIAKSHFILII